MPIYRNKEGIVSTKLRPICGYFDYIREGMYSRFAIGLRSDMSAK